MTSIGIGSIIPDKVMPIADETSNGFPQSPIKYNKWLRKIMTNKAMITPLHKKRCI